MNRNYASRISCFSFKRGVFFNPLIKHKQMILWKREIVPIQFLINITLSIKWALDEFSPTKLMFLCIMDFFTFSRNFAELAGGWVNFAGQLKMLHLKFYFDVVNHLLSANLPTPTWPDYPPPIDSVMLLITNCSGIWQQY